MVANGDYKRAIPTWPKGELRRELGDHEDTTWSLLAFAGLRAAQGEAHVALCLASAAMTVRNQLGVRLTSTDNSTVSRWLAPARQALSELSSASHADPAARAAQTEVGPNDVLYKVQHGDSVGRLAAEFYGDWQLYTPIVEASRDRVQPDGMTLGATGMIKPGWTLIIPEPSKGVRIDEDGNRWYTVERGDTLWGISDELPGDGQRWPEVFELNHDEARVDDAHVLSNPNPIWPELEVELPHDDRVATAASPVPTTEAKPTAPEAAPNAASRARGPDAGGAQSADHSAIAPPQEVVTELPTAPPPPPTLEPVVTSEPTPTVQQGELPPPRRWRRLPRGAWLRQRSSAAPSSFADGGLRLICSRRKATRGRRRLRRTRPHSGRRADCWVMAAAIWPAWSPAAWPMPTPTASTSRQRRSGPRWPTCGWLLPGTDTASRVDAAARRAWRSPHRQRLSSWSSATNRASEKANPMALSMTRPSRRRRRREHGAPACGRKPELPSRTPGCLLSMATANAPQVAVGVSAGGQASPQ